MGPIHSSGLRLIFLALHFVTSPASSHAIRIREGSKHQTAAYFSEAGTCTGVMFATLDGHDHPNVTSHIACTGTNVPLGQTTGKYLQQITTQAVIADFSGISSMTSSTFDSFLPGSICLLYIVTKSRSNLV
jgi:hypothetical protein